MCHPCYRAIRVIVMKAHFFILCMATINFLGGTAQLLVPICLWTPALGNHANAQYKSLSTGIAYSFLNYSMDEKLQVVLRLKAV